ncbi:MAG TPA: hypothetical protein VF913_03920 [Xanthobacteraceae bacterium]
MNDPELKAMGTIAQALAGLSDEQRHNVLLYLNARYGVQRSIARVSVSAAPADTQTAERYKSLGDFFDAVDPQTEADRVLTVSYWLQVVEGAADVEAFGVNKQLKNLGHSVSNITRALDSLIAQAPRLVIQISKTGSTKQARKKYKVTREGIKRVQAMLEQNIGDADAG